MDYPTSLTRKIGHTKDLLEEVHANHLSEEVHTKNLLEKVYTNAQELEMRRFPRIWLEQRPRVQYSRFSEIHVINVHIFLSYCQMKTIDCHIIQESNLKKHHNAD